MIHFIIQPTDEIGILYGFICGGGKKTRNAGNSNWHHLSAKNRFETLFLSVKNAKIFTRFWTLTYQKFIKI
jgi:hypothetical protein